MKQKVILNVDSSCFYILKRFNASRQICKFCNTSREPFWHLYCKEISIFLSIWPIIISAGGKNVFFWKTTSAGNTHFIFVSLRAEQKKYLNFWNSKGMREGGLRREGDQAEKFSVGAFFKTNSAKINANCNNLLLS